MFSLASIKVKPGRHYRLACSTFLIRPDRVDFAPMTPLIQFPSQRVPES
jgi:hypothetical protein